MSEVSKAKGAAQLPKPKKKNLKWMPAAEHRATKKKSGQKKKIKSLSKHQAGNLSKAASVILRYLT